LLFQFVKISKANLSKMYIYLILNKSQTLLSAEKSVCDIFTIFTSFWRTTVIFLPFYFDR
jgi:hypothetical protein